MTPICGVIASGGSNFRACRPSTRCQFRTTWCIDLYLPSPAFSHGKECSRDYVIAKGNIQKTKSRLPGRDFVKLATGEAV